MVKISPVAIIGAGPAGIAAAMQLQRLGIEFLLFEPNLATGSLLKNAWRVENYPGATPGINGLELLSQLQQILLDNQINPIVLKVVSLDYSKPDAWFVIKTNQTDYYAKRVIVATGTKPKALVLRDNLDPDLKPYLASEVFDLLKLRHQKIAIIGAGDAAFDYALNLANSNQVHIFNHAQTSLALPLLIKQALAHKNISYTNNHRLIAVSQPRLLLKFNYNNQINSYNFDYLITAIGRVAQKDCYSKQLRAIEKQLLATNKLFLIGDVKNNSYRQVAIATGDGILAAMHIGTLCR